MTPESLIPVASALAHVLSAAQPLDIERVALAQALDRTLGADLIARRNQPPFPAAAMDGYAVRAADLASAGARLKVIGEAAAGHAFAGAIRPGEAVRILTGAPLPEGSDAVLIQEDARREGESVFANEGPSAGRFVRAAGRDFAEGQGLLAAGTRLGPREVALAAAMNHAEVPVHRRPRVAIIGNGDELVPPGTTPGPDQIIASNTFAVAGMVARAGGIPVDVGLVPDDHAALARVLRQAADTHTEVAVTIGGASVGDHDFVRPALAAVGAELAFHKVAMRPGKPLTFGRLGSMLVLGLPGNPVSSVVCALLFLVPLLRALQGEPDPGSDRTRPARLGAALPANDRRQDYLRAMLSIAEDGVPVARALPDQDSSLLAPLARAHALIVRPPFAPPAPAGAPCRILSLETCQG